MKIIPSENFSLISQLKKDEVLTKVQAIAGQERSVKFLGIGIEHTKPYEGSITNEGFKINRVVRYGNSLLPIFHGHILNSDSVNEIKIKARVGRLQLIFLLFWLIVWGSTSVVFLLGIIQDIYNKHIDIFSFVIPSIFFAGYFFMRIIFYKENKRTKKFLLELLDAEEIDNK